MPGPIQVWEPFIPVSPLDPLFLRDFQRAQQEWKGESRIWLHPPDVQLDLHETQRWQRPQGAYYTRECMVLSEALNCIDVINVDEQRRTYPLLGTEKKRFALPEGLYRLWLNSHPRPRSASSYFYWDVPRLQGGDHPYRRLRVGTGPGPVLPVVGPVDVEKITLAWPPPGTRSPLPVSAEMESRAYYGNLRYKRARRKGVEHTYVATERDRKMHAIPMWYAWPHPFDDLFALGGNTELLFHQAAMRACIRDLTSGDRTRAMHTIETWVQRLTGEAEVLLWHAWVLPKLTGDIDSLLWDVEGEFGISAPSWSELQRSPEFKKKLLELVKVRRVQGWLGYFWWEFYQDVMERTSVRLCQSCGAVIRGGHANRKYCSLEENVDCFRKQNALRQRKHRSAARQAPAQANKKR